jgi:riboflavin kinase
MNRGARGTDLLLLRTLATGGAIQKRVKVTTKKLGEEMLVSQQAVSQSLIRLEAGGLVERAMSSRGQLVKITRQGAAALRAEFAAYKKIFERSGRVAITGSVSSGLGEGAYYMGLAGYGKVLERFLGGRPYAGTLNLLVPASDHDALETLRESAGETVPGFEEAGRTFGPIKCFRADVEGVSALVVIPSRTHYRDTLEIVASTRLRDALKLSDGSRVRVSICVS